MSDNYREYGPAAQREQAAKDRATIEQGATMTDNLTPATPLQRIESALAWLGELRADATPGPWEVRDHELVRDASALPVIQSLWVADIDPVAGDAALIVALTHPAVLDAVEAVLRTATDAAMVERKWETLVYTEDAVAIADALLATKPGDIDANMHSPQAVTGHGATCNTQTLQGIGCDCTLSRATKSEGGK